MFIRKTGFLPVLFSSILSAVPVAQVDAQPTLPNNDDQLDEVVVVTAARIPLALDDRTTSLFRLDEADLEVRGQVFIADVLRTVPGLAVSRSGPAGALTQIRMRGSEANHVLVLIDGIEAGSPFTGEADFAHLRFDDLFAAEVAGGEQSALWGADAIGGVIQLVSRHPDGREAQISLEGGSMDTIFGSLSAGQGDGDGYVHAGYSRYRTDGIDASGLGGDTETYDSHQLTARFARQMGRDWKIGGQLRWIDHATGYDTDTDWDGRLNDSAHMRRGEQVFAGLRVDGQTRTGSVEWLHHGALQLADDSSQTELAPIELSRSIGQRQRAYYQLSGLWESAGWSHRLTGLAEFERDRTKNYTGPGSAANQSRVVDTQALAVDYGAERGAFDLTASLRHESNEAFDDATTWRIGAAWQFDRINGRLRASTGEAVKNPGLFELFGYFPGFFLGNPDLTPERSRGWEIGFDQTLANGRFDWSVTVFQSKLDDEIYTDFGTFPATARNAAHQSERQGVEVSSRWQAGTDMSVLSSISWIDSEENGVAEIRRPEHLASVTLAWTPETLPWSGSLSLDYTGEQIDTDFATYQRVVLDDYVLASARLRYQLRSGAEVYVRGDNLLDEDYEDVVGFHTPGRALYVGLRFRHG